MSSVFSPVQFTACFHFINCFNSFLTEVILFQERATICRIFINCCTLSQELLHWRLFIRIIHFIFSVWIILSYILYYLCEKDIIPASSGGRKYWPGMFIVLHNPTLQRCGATKASFHKFSSWPLLFVLQSHSYNVYNWEIIFKYTNILVSVWIALLYLVV
jgi:hypothetical protein